MNNLSQPKPNEANLSWQSVADQAAHMKREYEKPDPQKADTDQAAQEEDAEES